MNHGLESGESPRVRRSRARRLAALVYASVYATLILMSELTYLGDKGADPVTAVTVVAGTAGVLYLAHVYADVLADVIAHGQRIRMTRLRTIALDSLPMLVLAVVPTGLLALSAAGIFRFDPMINTCLWVETGGLALSGWAAAHLASAGRWATPVIAAVTLAVGLLIVFLKYALH